MEEKLKEDLKQAQLSRDEIKVSTLRLLLSEIKNAEIAKSAALSDQEITGVIQRELKKRREAAAGFRQGEREEAAQKEELEAKILESYLPEQITDEELTKLIDEAISTHFRGSLPSPAANANKDLQIGKIMSIVMSRVAGKADGGRVSQLVKEKLQNQ